MGQDNETLRARVSRAVMEAVLEAGRAHPGAKDIYLDLDQVLPGMCDAIVITASAMGQMPDNPEDAVQLMKSMEERIVEAMRHITELIRLGKLPPPPGDRPKLHLVD